MGERRIQQSGAWPQQAKLHITFAPTSVDRSYVIAFTRNREEVSKNQALCFCFSTVISACARFRGAVDVADAGGAPFEAPRGRGHGSCPGRCRRGPAPAHAQPGHHSTAQHGTTTRGRDRVTR
eukprot:6207688-Pleurochrysis_carterae.AAC.3